jgi:hypothetical protein
MARIGWSRNATLDALVEARRRAVTIAGKMMDLAGEVQDVPTPFPFDLRKSAAKAYGIADACRDASADITGGVGWFPSRLMLPGLLKAVSAYERNYAEIVDGLEAGRNAFNERSNFAERKPD